MNGKRREQDKKVARDHDTYLAVQLRVQIALFADVRIPIDQNRSQTEASSIRDLDDEETQSVITTMRK